MCMPFIVDYTFEFLTILLIKLTAIYLLFSSKKYCPKPNNKLDNQSLVCGHVHGHAEGNIYNDTVNIVSTDILGKKTLILNRILIFRICICILYPLNKRNEHSVDVLF